MDSIEEMKKCILCLHIELPEPIMNDVDKKWGNVLKEIERLRQALESIQECADIDYICSTMEARSALLAIQHGAKQALKEE